MTARNVIAMRAWAADMRWNPAVHALYAFTAFGLGLLAALNW